jgi:putative hydrolase of the HAD superfamily
MVVVLTEGNQQKVFCLLDYHGLRKLVDRVIAAPKSDMLFKRIMKLAGRPAATFVIGDQLDRDIQPAKAVGVMTIFFPGGFRPKWQPPEMNVKPDYKVEDFRQAAAIIVNCLPRQPKTARTTSA